jgi:hypothetical protein
MDTMVRFGCGVLAVIVLFVIIWRRRNRATE